MVWHYLYENWQKTAPFGPYSTDSNDSEGETPMLIYPHSEQYVIKYFNEITQEFKECAQFLNVPRRTKRWMAQYQFWIEHEAYYGVPWTGGHPPEEEPSIDNEYLKFFGPASRQSPPRGWSFTLPRVQLQGKQTTQPRRWYERLLLPSLPINFDAEGKIVGVEWGPEVDGWHDVSQAESDAYKNGTDGYKAGTVRSDQEGTIGQENIAEIEAGVGALSIPNNEYEVAEVVQNLAAPQTKEENSPHSEECAEQQKSELLAEAETGSVSDISSCCSSPPYYDWNTQFEAPPPPISIAQYGAANDDWSTPYQAPPPPPSITHYSAAHNLGETHLHPDTDTGLTGFATTKLQISSSCQATLKANHYHELSALEEQSGAHILAFDPFHAENGDVSTTAIDFIQGDPFARHQAVKLLTAFQMNLESQPPESNANFRFLGPGRKRGKRKSKKT